MDELFQRLQAQGYEVIPEFNGEYQRFDRGGKTLAGWFLGHTFQGPHGNILTADYGDWVTKERCEWRSDTKENYSKEDLEKLKFIVEELNKKRSAAKDAERAAAAKRAQDIWQACGGVSLPKHPYLEKKKIFPGLAGLMQGSLVIPVYCGTLAEKQIVSLQFIDSEGEKKFLPGGRLKGCHSIAITPEWDKSTDTIYIAEGYATAMSVAMATNSLVLIAFNASNIPALCNTLPVTCKRVVICADNDQWTEGNPGLAFAKKAQKLLANKNVPCAIAAPQFPKDGEKRTDWNDWHAAHGLESVKENINQQATFEVQRAGGQAHGLPHHSTFEPLPVRFNANGKPVPPPQSAVMSALIDQLENCCLRDGREVFVWQGTHWEEQEPFEFKQYIRRCAQRLLSGAAKDKELNDIYNMFLSYLPATRHTFYRQNPSLCNFLDGTLEVRRGDIGAYELFFRRHDKCDLLTWVLPYHYLSERQPNPLFDSWLARCFEGDADKEGKIRALAQIGGASLVSLFPRTCFLHGKAGTGKSTFAKLCLAFIGAGNYSSVEPKDQSGFNMELMINKQANIVTDISEGYFDPAVLKRVEDRVPVFINRKNRQAILGFLPALNLYCANKLPKGIDTASDAFDRRISIVEFDNVVTNGAYTRDYEAMILKEGPGAVLQFFLQGLADLCASGGVYFNPESGVKKLREWKDSESLAAQFIEAISCGEIPELRLSSGHVSKRSNVSSALMTWSGRNLDSRSVSRVFSDMEARGFTLKRDKNGRYIVGIEVRGQAGVSHNDTMAGDPVIC